MDILSMENVNKIINKHQVLSDISFAIPEGGVYALIGTNGSGKSMLLRLLCGLIHATSGTVRYRDQVIHRDIDLPPSIGVIIESPGFWPELSGADNLRLFARIKGIATEDDIFRGMEQIGLESGDPKPVRKYSLGMRQKLGIVQAMMEKPEILLLDEPMNALDKGTVKIVKSMLVQAKAKGTTIVLASHHDEDFIDLANHRIELYEGRIIEETDIKN